MAERAIVMRIQRCQCEACKTVQHASYCAVHNAPALPIGKCNCDAWRQISSLLDVEQR
jgi:hypothetical protein